MVGRPMIRSRTKVNNIEVQDIMVGDEGKAEENTMNQSIRIDFSPKGSSNVGNQLSGREWHCE